MTRAELIALAERVEKATWSDPLLDQLVWKANAPKTWSDSPILNLFIHGYDEWGCNTADGYRHFSCGRVAPYTASLDAAASLVPAEWRWMLDCLNTAGPIALCEHWPPGGQPKPYLRGVAATPAPTLTAAALRAMAEEARDE